MRFTAIISLVLVVALCSAWATINYYSISRTVDFGAGGSFANIIHQGQNRVKVSVAAGALDTYMIEQGVNQVVYTVDLEEEWIDTGNGTGYYRLDFTFGPSGAHFEPPLEIQLSGKYVSANNAVAMYDENGELLETTSNGNGSKITYFVPHFSSYYYDDYDEY
jgi:hypothetical protein